MTLAFHELSTDIFLIYEFNFCCNNKFLFISIARVIFVKDTQKVAILLPLIMTVHCMMVAWSRVFIDLQKSIMFMNMNIFVLHFSYWCYCIANSTNTLNFVIVHQLCVLFA